MQDCCLYWLGALACGISSHAIYIPLGCFFKIFIRQNRKKKNWTSVMHGDPKINAQDHRPYWMGALVCRFSPHTKYTALWCYCGEIIEEKASNNKNAKNFLCTEVHKKQVGASNYVEWGHWHVVFCLMPILHPFNAILTKYWRGVVILMQLKLMEL
jgi:hypothetical protein